MPQGLIVKKLIPQSIILGANSPIRNQSINKIGDWSKYLPTKESQYRLIDGQVWDSYGCVSFSALNCIETYEKFWGKINNYSDRFLAKISGTVPGTGNYFDTVADSLVNFGYINEEDLPFDPVNYYSEIPNDLILKAKLNSQKWIWQYVAREDWEKALTYAPLQVGVNGTKSFYNVHKNEEKIYNHAVMLIKLGDNPTIFDHYTPEIKEMPKDYNFMPWAIQFVPINNTYIKYMEIKNNYLYVCNYDRSQFIGLGLDHRLIANTKEEDKFNVYFQFIARNNGKVEGKFINITPAQWDSVEKIDLKGNKI